MAEHFYPEKQWRSYELGGPVGKNSNPVALRRKVKHTVFVPFPPSFL